MARQLDPEQHTAKRNQILETAQRLVYTKGFERMTIQDILNELGISKGAFFHYFSSKNDLLEALIKRMVEDILKSLETIVFDPTLPAAKKLERYFAAALRWKTERKEFLLKILRAWYMDENAVVHQKVLRKSLEQITPYLARILQQGNEEGCWHVDNPSETVKMMIYVLQGLSDAISMQLLSDPPVLDRKALAELVSTYTQAVERLLDARQCSLVLLNIEDLAVWFEPSAMDKSPTYIDQTADWFEDDPSSKREEKVP